MSHHAALMSRGPPRKQSGATMAPMTAECSIQANCLVPTPGLYSILLIIVPVPIIKANDARIACKQKMLKLK